MFNHQINEFILCLVISTLFDKSIEYRSMEMLFNLCSGYQRQIIVLQVCITFHIFLIYIEKNPNENTSIKSIELLLKLIYIFLGKKWHKRMILH